ncbi:MAG: caspase family protein [Dehalococcoidia bacterium]|nr:caspase family protein [Dehalococcoidia bacterium]
MKRLMVGVLVAVLVLVLIAPAVLAKPDMNKPLPATDVELVKKVTLRGKPGGGGGPVSQAATGLLGEQLGTGADRYAIIVGISDYPGTGSDLQYCDDDADDIYAALTTLYGYSPDNIHLLLNMDASFTAIQGAISDVKSQEVAGDEVVFFFSGHGTKAVADDGDKEKTDEAIVSHDGNPSGRLVAIWDGQLKAWFSGFNTSRIIFIFDSCLAGGMTDLQSPGRLINMACSESGVSYEDASWGNGQFTYYFVAQGMLAGKADRYDHDNNATCPDVTIEEAFDYAKANCQVQKPIISDSFDNDLLP